jgi:uncharacterized Zn finger protein (UPF0148 family)
MKRGAAWKWFGIFAVIAAAASAYARVGGGGSYSGGSGGGGGGDDIAGEIVFLIFRLLFWLTLEHPLIGIPIDIIVIICVIRWMKSSKAGNQPVLQASVAPLTSATQPLNALRKFDPNFSESVFADFCYSLYGHAHEARGSKRLDQYAPYLSASARQSLAAIHPGVDAVRGVIVGSYQIAGARGLDTPTVEVTVMFEANYTEVTDGREMSWYVKEQWVLERARDILSPAPGKAKADHCPRCGAALKTRSDGSCSYCGVKIENGAFQWFVTSVATTEREARGPLLTSTVPERGTDRATVMQANFASAKQAFVEADPTFQWGEMEARIRMIATELQDAWSSLDWEKARVHETEPLFQMHRYWIDAYRAQKLRNIVDDFKVARVQPVRISSDAFYDAITVRIWASGKDYTTDERGSVVAGSPTALREWSEYWTLIRSRTASKSGTIACPNCGASVSAGTTGICSYCGGKLTAGAFDWVLSRIEQDESYRG